MAASTANRTGVDVDLEVGYLSLPVAASTHIYQGTSVCYDGSGNIVAAADTSGLVSAGLAASEADNSAGIAGAVTCKVIPPTAKPFVLFDATSPTVASWHGKLVYFVDDHTVALAGTTTNDVVAGRVVQVQTTGSSGKVVVDTSDRA